MNPVRIRFSKSRIDKAGEILKSKKEINKQSLNESFEVLSNWRAYHVASLEASAKILRARAKKISKHGNAIVAQRLKRTPSILLKLKTHKSMRLSAMQDIGGLRVVFDTIAEVYELVELYRFSKTRQTLFSMNDYIERPKDDGYRSVHLVYKMDKSPSLFLEIQVRSHLQHIWATGVEVFGTLQSTSFKSGYGDKKWLELFALLSSVFAIKEGTPVLKKHKSFSKAKLLKQTKELIQKLRAIEQLNIYTEIYTAEELRVTKGRRGNYGLVLLDSIENKTTVTTFAANEIEAAEAAYLELEKKYYKNKDMNVVLVNAGDIKKLEISYPNYFMDTKTLVRNLSLIMVDGFL
ncbi:MAG: RelA/SpoT domain-containing protein [Pseudobdellovibrionaceae bacterium]|nr:MAG: RelA/SpoT domain-containing protein [Pseudobdellovibrionaceae bacterium]